MTFCSRSLKIGYKYRLNLDNMNTKRTAATIIIISILFLTACQTYYMKETNIDLNSYEEIYSLYNNLDLSQARSLCPDISKTCYSYKAVGIPLVPLSNEDIEEFYCCLNSVYTDINRELIVKDSEDNTLVLAYDDGNICGEFLHSVIHINTGKIASVQGNSFRSSYVPQFDVAELEIYRDEIINYSNKSYELLDGEAKLSNIVEHNDSLLKRLYVPYMDASIDLQTQKIKLFNVWNNKMVVACYSQASLDGLVIDNENGYASESQENVPNTWRCVTFYTDQQTIDVIDIYRGISGIELSNEVTISESLDQALRILSDKLPKEKLHVVSKIEFVYAYYPVEPYVGLYLDQIPVNWNRYYLLCPVWKINVINREDLSSKAFFINPTNGDLHVYRIIEPGY